MMEIIRSVKQEYVSKIIHLSDYSCRSNSNYIPLYGLASIQWAENAGLEIEVIFIAESVMNNYIDHKLRKKYKSFIISDFLNKKITNISHIVDVCGIASKKESSLNDLIANQENFIVFDRVLDHGNIGSIIRTMRGFNFNNLILTDYNIDVYYKNIVNSSRGESFQVNCFNIKYDDIIEKFKANYQIICTKADCDINVNKLENNNKIKNPFVVIFGNESDGVSDKLINISNISLGIPMKNSVDSLNIGVAAGIILNKLQDA